MHPVFLFIMDIFYLLMRSISSSRSILSFSFSCILLRQIAKNKPGPTSDQKMPVPLLYRADKELA